MQDISGSPWRLRSELPAVGPFLSSTRQRHPGFIVDLAIIVTVWLHPLNRPLLEKQSEGRAERKDLSIRTSSA